MEKQNKKNGTFGRLLRYIYKNYRVYMITVIICIIIAAAASVVQTVFLQRLIDTCILPGLENGFESIRQPFIQTIDGHPVCVWCRGCLHLHPPHGDRDTGDIKAPACGHVR